MPPCNCHPPFPRPEPFSPLPRPGRVPDWGKWIRDRLSEKGALLVFPTRASFPSPGAWPNLYLDQETGAVYRWDREDYAVLFGPQEGNDVLVYDSVAAFPDEGEQGKLYIAANTGSLYRWGGEGYVALLPGKADKVVPAAEGNLAELTQDGNLADSGKKPADFADAENTYTKAETDEAIDRVAAYYITRNAAGDAFETKAQLNSATVFYSGGKVRTPTRNDYCVVLADESQGGAEYRYIYAVAEDQTTGSWQPQFPVEGVMTVDQTVTKNSTNPVASDGVWSAIWGALSAIPAGFSSLYDWCVAQLAGKASTADATLTERGFTGWACNPSTVLVNGVNYPAVVYRLVIGRDVYWALGAGVGAPPFTAQPYDETATSLTFSLSDSFEPHTVVATREALQGYVLGPEGSSNPNRDKPLASEAEADALRNGKQNTLTAQQLANIAAVPDKADKSAVDPLLFARYYPEGNVKSTAEFTSGIKYDAPDTTNRTITVKPFCNTGDSDNDNSDLEGRVVIPPFVDGDGNPYISDDGTKYKVVGVGSFSGLTNPNTNLTTIVAPNTVMDIGGEAFTYCTSLASASLPAATDIGVSAFSSCAALTSVLLPAATGIGDSAFVYCAALTSVDFGNTPRSNVPSLGVFAFSGVPTSCNIIVPYTQYDEWKAASGWSALPQEFVRHAEKADKPATFTTGNLAKFDANGNPVDSGKKAGDFATAAQGTKADTAIQGVKVNGTEITPDAQKKVNLEVATKADATLTERRFSAWVCDPPTYNGHDITIVASPHYAAGMMDYTPYADGEQIGTEFTATEDATYIHWDTSYALVDIVATRTALQGYQLGSQSDRPLASEAEAEVLRTGKANRAANPTAGNLAALDANGNPTDSGVKASDKLDSTSAAPAFSDDSTVQYAVGEHVTYNGKLYKCTTATTGGMWDASKWTADTMTDPDAVLDITSQNQLRVVAKDGTLLWAQGYDLASTSSATLACDAANNFTFANGATSQAFALPTAPTGKVGDFGLDIDNSANASAATLTLTGLDSTFSVVVPEGESLTDMLSIAAGELARFYISLSTFRVNNLPTWHILKQVVENGGAQS